MLIAVMIGGALGALSRYLVGLAIARASVLQMSEGLSWATFSVNIVGSFLLAFLVFGFADGWRPELKLAVMTGFLGSFTTFSTFEIETLRLVESGQIILALAYVALSVVVGFAAALMGRWLALLIS